MNKRILQLLLLLMIFCSYSCYRCEEVEDFYRSSINVAIIDVDTENILPERPDDLIIFRDGEIDSTGIEMGSNWRIRLDDWEIENFRTIDGSLNTDTIFNLEYHLHFIRDTIAENLINIDTIIVTYSIRDTDCNVVDIDDLEVTYNNEMFPVGGYPFYTIRI